MPHQYAIDVLAEDGRLLEHAVVQPDWQPALDWTHFDGLRAGALPAVTRTGPGTVEPIWDGRAGAPYVSGFRVTVRAGEHHVVREIPKAYLERTAREISADVVRRHHLEPGTVVRWIASAVPAGQEATPNGAAGTADDRFDVEEIARPLPVDEAPLAALVANAVLHDGVDATRRLVPVFVPATILEQAKTLTRQAGDVETGGVLVGRLHRDPIPAGGGAGELFVEITAQVPAAHTTATSTSLTFTAATWAAVRAALADRGRVGEILVGWWHAHLDWCRLRGCPLERRRTCAGARPFFSAEDVHLHTTCFPAGYQVALLISDSAASGGLTATVFGWSRGLVVAREFYVLTKGARHAASRTA